MPPKFSELPPKLVIVMVCVPVLPTFCEKSRVAGENPIAEGCGVGNGIGVIPKT